MTPYSATTCHKNTLRLLFAKYLLLLLFFVLSCSALSFSNWGKAIILFGFCSSEFLCTYYFPPDQVVDWFEYTHMMQHWTWSTSQGSRIRKATLPWQLVNKANGEALYAFDSLKYISAELWQVIAMKFSDLHIAALCSFYFQSYSALILSLHCLLFLLHTYISSILDFLLVAYLHFTGRTSCWISVQNPDP